MPESTQHHELVFRAPDKQVKNELHTLTRRELLKQSLAVSTGLVLGAGFIAGSSAAWALELKALTPQTMATLVQMARDIFPHDTFGDELYAAAVKGHDEKAAEDASFKAMLEDGVAQLDQLAKDQGHADYLSTGWEIDRTNILKSIETESFFQTIRGGLVVGLYNQPAVWEILGYEGPSYDKGGYLDRGFDDIDWL